jgi:hypothetical protein
LIRAIIKAGLSQTWFERSAWFLESDLVTGFVPEGRDPNDRGARLIAARDCLTMIARDSRDDPAPWLALLGARGHGVYNASLDAREDKAMELLGRKDKRHFRYVTKPKWVREVALELYRELTRDDS